MRLTELGEGAEDTWRRAELDELVPIASDSTAIRTVIQKLALARLVTTNVEQVDNKTEQTAIAPIYVEVAHEALIREWPMLRHWLDENREDCACICRLTAAAQEWKDLGMDKGALWRGTRLQQAAEWATIQNKQLNELETSFVQASVMERKLAVEEEERQNRENSKRQLLAAERTLAAKRQKNRAVLLG